MITYLLILIYISFISLGLPDTILGSAWPSMFKDLNVPIAYAGIISMTIAGGTIISSFLGNRMIRRFGTGIVTAVSVCMTAVALLGFSISTGFWMLLIWAIPYGLGAGTVDVALNNYVALHFKAKHMNWLHCFWGVGAMTGPYIMGYCLTNGMKWETGYRSIFYIQVILAVILMFSLPAWKAVKEEHSEEKREKKALGFFDVLKLNGAKPALFAFFAYCALESGVGLWASSFMVLGRGISAETAAKWASLLYLGITIGRFISGFISMKLKDKELIRYGQVIAVLGILLLFMPMGKLVLCAGFVLVGLGLAPIYPCMIHITPENFGREASQAIIGIQMGFAYIGSTFVPPVIGFVVERINIQLFPYLLLGLAALMILMSERLFRWNAK